MCREGTDALGLLPPRSPGAPAPCTPTQLPHLHPTPADLSALKLAEPTAQSPARAPSRGPRAPKQGLLCDFRGSVAAGGARAPGPRLLSSAFASCACRAAVTWLAQQVPAHVTHPQQGEAAGEVEDARPAAPVQEQGAQRPRGQRPGGTEDRGRDPGPHPGKGAAGRPHPSARRPGRPGSRGGAPVPGEAIRKTPRPWGRDVAQGARAARVFRSLAFGGPGTAVWASPNSGPSAPPTCDRSVGGGCFPTAPTGQEALRRREPGPRSRPLGLWGGLLCSALPEPRRGPRTPGEGTSRPARSLRAPRKPRCSGRPGLRLCYRCPRHGRPSPLRLLPRPCSGGVRSRGLFGRRDPLREHPGPPGGQGHRFSCLGVTRAQAASPSGTPSPRGPLPHTHQHRGTEVDGVTGPCPSPRPLPPAPLHSGGERQPAPPQSTGPARPTSP